jgi:hypothetical protein
LKTNGCNRDQSKNKSNLPQRRRQNIFVSCFAEGVAQNNKSLRLCASAVKNLLEKYEANQPVTFATHHSEICFSVAVY